MRYGTKIGPSRFSDHRDGFGDVDLASAGNVVVRVGREMNNAAPSWEQIAHVVLTPDEWDSIVDHVAALRAEQQIRNGVTS